MTTNDYEIVVVTFTKSKSKSMKREFIKIRHCPWSKYTPWCVIVPKDLNRGIATKRKRHYFQTREETESYRDHVLDVGYVQAERDRSATATHHDTGEIALSVSNGHGNGRLLSECVREWMSRFQQAKPTYFQARQIMRPLMARLGSRRIDSIGTQDLDTWLRSLGAKYSSTTQHNYWRRTRQFFTHCHDFGWIASNPMKTLKEPRCKRAKRHILKPEQMRQCLEAAKEDRALMAYLCLGGFAGIRTSEILAMDWDDLFWEENEIRIPEGKDVENADAKEVWFSNGDNDDDEEISGDRMVTMEKAFCRHLEPLALKGAAIDAAAKAQKQQNGRPSRKLIPGGQRKLYEIRAKLRTLLGVEEWPNNCLRHSYKSYHIAAFRNLELTRAEMGHSHSNTTKYKYGAARMKVVAEQWWAL